MDQKQFTNLYREFLPQVSKYLVRRVDKSDVEELASRIFEIAWLKRAQAPEGFELPWVYRIAGHVVANHRRAKLAESNFMLRLMPADFSPSAEDLAVFDLELSKAWRKLSAFEREIIALSAFEGLSNLEIAKVLEITANAASQRLTKARAKLRENLSK